MIGLTLFYRVAAMKKFLNLICILGATAMLAACSYFDTGDVDVSNQPPGQAIDLTTGQPIGATPQPVNLSEVAARVSDGSVEIFPFEDGGVSAPMPVTNNSVSSDINVESVPAVPTYPQSGHAIQPNPSVEVFPLDDDMAKLIHAEPVYTGNTTTTSDIQPLLPEAAPFSADDRGSDFAAVSVPGAGQSVVYFEHDMASVRSEDESVLSSLARSYNGSSTIEVAGHASTRSSMHDPIQRKIVNLKISMERAFNVAKALIEAGVPAERIETKGYGETRPPADSAGSDLEIASRRVEISGISRQ